MMEKINIKSGLALDKIAKVVARAGLKKNRILLQGDTGIGKTYVAKKVRDVLAAQCKDYPVCFTDCQNQFEGDLTIPMFETEDGQKFAVFTPPKRFQTYLKKPLLYILDEYTKAKTGVQNMFAPMIESGRLGDVYIHPDSIIVLTGNDPALGLGDTLAGHLRSRLTVIPVAKPDSEAWITHAMERKFNPILISWANEFPQAFASYQDAGQADNEYIFNPRNGGSQSYVCPRTLEFASRYLDDSEFYDDDELSCLVCGVVGDFAGKSIMSYKELAGSLPTKDAIAKSPLSATVPDNKIAQLILVYGVIAWPKLDKNNLRSFMKYVQREGFAPEIAATFGRGILRSPRGGLVNESATFKDWCVANHWILDN